MTADRKGVLRVLVRLQTLILFASLAMILIAAALPSAGWLFGAAAVVFVTQWVTLAASMIVLPLGGKRRFARQRKNAVRYTGDYLRTAPRRIVVGGCLAIVLGLAIFVVCALVVQGTPTLVDINGATDLEDGGIRRQVSASAFYWTSVMRTVWPPLAAVLIFGTLTLWFQRSSLWHADLRATDVRERS